MQQTIETIRKQFSNDLTAVETSLDLEEVKVRFLGRKGPVQQLMHALKDVSPDQRPELGKFINTLKEDLQQTLEVRKDELLQVEEERKQLNESIDISIPGRRSFLGHKHIVMQVLDEMIEILVSMGFSVHYGPDIDTDYYNFEALNFPHDHPARDMQDTFYIAPDVLLRTHTSNVQVRVMEQYKPPLRVIAPGKAYRNEAISARSHVFFMQVEGFYIDKGVTFVDLLSTLREFLNKLFKKEIKVRFRPSYFPFVEPGVEVDIHCLSCNGAGCPICKQTGWLEVAGAGMIHPEVLKNGDIDPETYTGYAWGIGVERLAMLRHGIKDIRLFTQNDTRFLKQFTSL